MKYVARTLLLIWVFLSATFVYPSSCTLVSQRNAFNKAKVVFIGQPVAYADNANVDKDGRLIVRFKIERAFKGIKTSEIIIQSEFGAVYGFHFEIGKRYIVYAYGNKLFAPTVCSRSAEIVDARFAEYRDQQKEIANLDSWRKP